MTMNRWNTPGIPHKGWSCIFVEDLGPGESQPCEMCGNERVRYVHIMLHEEYEQELSVGCVCAGKMSDDYAGAKERERVLKNKAAKRMRWVQRRWPVSKKGNQYMNVKGHHVGVFMRDNYWTCWMDGKISCRNFKSADEAKMYLFDRINKD